ncbi:Acyl-CoA-binding domain-containing protein 3 [Abeliophyllum distichum]|uniref:Acyl-CoA-binding domain-containing protein 3 n=1 Tax=Abeliophyllum distichum TaxID=126358 RepID=A0ABD1SZF4_9LAMI
MDFFQELFFTAFLAFILSFVIVKFVLIAVSNSSDEGKTAIFSVEEVKSGNRLKVGSMKSKKRVKFADDVEVRKIDQYQDEKGFENLGLCFDESVGEVNVEERSEGEKIAKRVDQFEGDELNRDYGIKISRAVQDSVDEDKGSENIGMLIEKTNECNVIGEICGEKEDIVVSGGLEGVIFREMKNGEELESPEVETDQKEGNWNGAAGENEELIEGDVEEEKVRDGIVDDEDDDWEGIERSDLEKVFAEAVNYVEYGGKGEGERQ